MNIEEENMKWENEAPLLASLKKDQSFLIPDNYFENLSAQIISQININEKLSSSVVNFKTPEGYFDALSSKISNQIGLEKLKSEGISNNYGFNIPSEDYFEKTNLSILAKATLTSAKKVKVFNLNFIRYASAACILLMTSAGIYFNVHNTKTVGYELSKVSNEEIETYLQQHLESSDIPILIKNLPYKSTFTINKSDLSEADLQDLIDTTL